jgi:heat shock protein HslJ
VTGIPEFASYPPVHHFLPIPADTPLRVEGDASTLRGTFSTIEDQEVSSMTLDAPGGVPTEPGRYVLRIDADLVGAGTHHGSATFFFGIAVAADVTPSAVPTVSPTFVGLARTSWQLVSVNGVAIPATIDGFTLWFTAARLGGNDGCNGFGSPYDVVGNSIRLQGNWTSTAVLCTGTVSYQSPLMGMLGSSNTFERTRDRLTIESPTTTMVFEPLYRI